MDSVCSPQVFLSYARPDERRVRLICDRLAKEGIDCWLDRDSIAPGMAWEAEVKQALNSVKMVLLCLSTRSSGQDGELQQELRWVLETWSRKAPGQLHLLPVKLDECAIDERLAEFHWVDLWDERGWQRLLDQIRRCVPPVLAQPRVEQKSRNSAALTPQQVRRLKAEESLSIPYVSFPAEVRRFLKDSMTTAEWTSLPDHTLRFITSLGCKLEPIVQIVPATPTPLVMGFECLGLGVLGESFEQICRTAREIDPGLLRLCLAVVSIKTVSTLRSEAVKSGHSGARNLIFSMNLDPFMLDSPHFKKLLLWYFTDLSHNMLFEVNETTTRQYLPKLKNLQSDFNLRYSADDLNNWQDDVREALIDRVEMTKMDYRSFKQAMDVRGDDIRRSLDMLLKHNMSDKPLIVEGIEDQDYLEFLERHWDYKRHGQLFGQGYCLDSSPLWNRAIQPLTEFRLPGGSYLADPEDPPQDDFHRH